MPVSANADKNLTTNAQIPANDKTLTASADNDLAAKSEQPVAKLAQPINSVNKDLAADTQIPANDATALVNTDNDLATNSENPSTELTPPTNSAATDLLVISENKDYLR